MHPILTIFKKELKDMLRDRRTIIAMIVLPLVLIPLIFTLFGKFSFSKGSDVTKEIKVAVFSNDNGAALMERLQRRRDLKIIEGVSPYEFEGMILDDSIDFGLIIDKNFDTQIEGGKTGLVELFHNSSSRDTSNYNRIAKTVRAYHQAIINERLSALGTSKSILKPTRIKKTNVNPEKGTISSFAGSILPMFFIMFCFMGAMYPAIDLFTGEKERGTIETLLVLPANRFHILIGKILVISVTGITSGLLTLLGIYFSLKFNPDFSFLSTVLNLESVFWITLMMIPLATFFAGLFVPITVYAKSFKEAQSLTQPLLFLVFIPIGIAMLPGFKLNLATAWIPILNISLACKDIVAGTVASSHLIIVYISLFLFAGLGLLLAKQWFGDEQNVFRN